MALEDNYSSGESRVEDDRSSSRRREPQRSEDLIDALPAVARVAATAWLRTAAWSVETGLRVSGRLARAAVDPSSAAELVEDLSTGMRSYAREFLGISDLDERVKQLMPGNSPIVAGPGPAAKARARRGRGRKDGAGQDQASLKALGAELLRQSADVATEDGSHPAYVRILEELAPDEGRILRLLAADGPQPVVDVRAASLIGVGSQLVIPGLNMIGPQAGLRHKDRLPQYLNNLERLGLITFSREAVNDAVAYQVLEAQPEVLAEIKKTTRAKTAHRSIRLTPFGEDFCEVCLPPQQPEPASGESRRQH